MNNHPDAIRLIEELGTDHPYLTQALGALGLQLDDATQQAVINVSERKSQPVYKKLPPVEQPLFEFDITYISEQKKYVNSDNSPIINNIEKELPLDIAKKPTPLPINTNLSMLWNSTLLHQQLQALLWQSKTSTQIDIPKIIEFLVKKEPLLKLPQLKVSHLPSEIWLYMDYSDGSNIFHAHYAQVERLLKSWFGSTVISQKIKLVNGQPRYVWRKDKTGELVELSQPPIGITAIVIAPNDRWGNGAWRTLANKLKQNNILSVYLPLQSSPVLQLPPPAPLSNLNKLFAALSLTPDVITVPMIYDIVINALNESINLAPHVIASSNINWYQGSDSGSWKNDCAQTQKTIDAVLSPQEQEDVIVIISQHLSHDEMCWLVGFQTLAYIHCSAISANTKNKLEDSIDKYNQGLASNFYKYKTEDYINWQMIEARKLGDTINALPNSAKRALTITNLLWQEQNNSSEQLEGLDEELWREWQQAKATPTIKGQLVQMGANVEVISQTHSTKTNGCVISDIEDISSLASTPSAALQQQRLTIKRNTNQKKTAQVRLNNKNQALTLTTQSSKSFYWAKSLSVTNHGVVAKTNFVQVSWPSQDVPNAQRGYQGAIITLLDGAPAWMQQFMPQLDEHGLFANIGTPEAPLKLRYMPPGSFVMGSPEDEAERGSSETQHNVTLTQGYWLGETTITQAQWALVMKDNSIKHKSRQQENANADLPVIEVNWLKAQTFLSQFNRRFKGLSLTLPTEAQWEYACRGGTTTPFNTGNNITTAQANYDGNFPYADNKEGEYREQAMPVHLFSPNDWGLYQMHGNVWEWCHDVFEPFNQTTTIDPVNGDDVDDRSARRVLRGGGWGLFAHFCRSAYRFRIRADFAGGNIGLRVAQVEPAGKN